MLRNNALFLILVVSISGFFINSTEANELRAPIALKINGSGTIEIEAEILNENNIKKIYLNDEFNELKQYLSPQLFSDLEVKNKKGFLAIEDIINLGINPDFDDHELVLNFKIPLKNTNSIGHSLGGQGYVPETQTPIFPEKFSGYLNLRNNDQIYQGKDNQLQTQMEGVLNYRKFVLENNYEYQHQSSHSPDGFNRIETRLNFDDTNRSIRTSLGDVSIPINSFMSSRNLGGLIIARNSTLNPYKTTTPVNEHEFIINNKSEVSIYINGQLSQVLSMLPGRYNLTDLPISIGVNEIHIEVKDQFGHRESYSFPYLGNRNLLKKNYHQFEIVMGKEQVITNNKRGYDSINGLTISASDYFGVTSQTTQGIYFQADKLQKLIGLDSLWATIYGDFRLETAFSEIANYQNGNVIRSSYYYSNSKNSIQKEWGAIFSITDYSRYFASLGNIKPNLNYQSIFELGFNKKLNDFFSLNLAGSFSKSVDQELHDLRKIDLGINFNLIRGLSTSASFSRQQASSGEWTSNYLCFLNYSFDNPQYGIYSTYNSYDDSYKISGRAQGTLTHANIDSNLSTEKSSTQDITSAQVSLTHHRFEVETHTDLIQNKIDNKTIKNSNINLNFALAFVGNHYAFSRPINSSFVLLSPNENLKGKNIVFNPNSKPAPYIDGFGNIIVGQYTPYQYSSLNIDSSGLDEGYTAGADYYTLLPGYKTGHFIEIGHDSTNAIIGQLLDRENHPIKLVMGYLKTKNEQIDFFTNENGEFFIENISPGQIHFIIDEKKSKDIVIGKGKSGKIDLKEVVIE